MYKVKFFLVMSLICLLSLSCLSNQKPKTITLFQNKVEISDELKEFTEYYVSENKGVDIKVVTVGGDAYADALEKAMQSDQPPDIFVIEGAANYNRWKQDILPFTNDTWIYLTDYEYMVNNQVIGFPIAIEAYGLIYNRELLRAAGIEPNSIVDYKSLKAAFVELENHKEELGIDAVVSMTAGPSMSWVTGRHNFNGYLAAGLAANDNHVFNQFLNGQVDEQRLDEFADWVELLFDYSDQDVLLNGNYDSQLSLFARKKSVFLHQGNWISPWLESNNIDFDMGILPHMATSDKATGIFIGVPSFYVINANSPYTKQAKNFLNFLAIEESGHEYMINRAKMIPAFDNIQLQPVSILSDEVLAWDKNNQNYAWRQNDMPDDFGIKKLAPIYYRFAKKEINKQEFKTAVKNAIKSIDNTQ